MVAMTRHLETKLREAGQAWLSCLFAARHVPWPVCLAGIAALAFGISMAMAWMRLPAPSCHDEFSHLLVADTVLHGRLANPSPEIWQPFQSFHVLVNPTYASKFPLGPGALLALGWFLFGSPAAGIWIGAALCAVAVTWAAAGCLSRRWAIVAGLLLTTNPNVHHQWSLSFMNGWLTAAAAAIVAGATLRLRKHTRWRDCLLLGIGIGGLALTRPFEGLVFTICCAGLLLFWWRSASWSLQIARIARIGACAAVPLSLCFALMAMHNRATTGNVWQMPYQLHEQQYGVAPLSIFQSPKNPMMTEWSANVPPTVLAFHYGWSLTSYAKRTGITGWCGAVADIFHVVSKLWGLSFCLLMSCMAFSRPGPHRLLTLAVALALLAGSFVPWYFSHYFAPSMVWVAILTALGVKWMIDRMVSDRQTARIAVATVLVVQMIWMTAEVAVANMRATTWADDRQAIVDRLQSQGGEHLILVRYQSDHDVHHEWVYNGADLENAPIIWARSWRPDLDSELLKHYPSRHVWYLDFDEQDRATLRK